MRIPQQHRKVFSIVVEAVSPNETLLSFVIPYYRKWPDFAFVVEYNKKYFANPRCEVVLVLDEPSEVADVLSLIEREDAVNWRIVVNDHAHPWRAPSKAINVGIRHAVGDSILVASPESVFIDDPVALCEDIGDCGFAVGRVVFLTFEEFSPFAPQDLDDAFDYGQRLTPRPIFYGSILAKRAAFHEVRGYEEGMLKHGGDDTNLRIRLMMAGYRMVPRLDLRLIHLSAQHRPTGHPVAGPQLPVHTFAEKMAWFDPPSAQANDPRWGTDFDRVVFDWAATP